MKELSLNILDVAKNSVRANAAHVEISLKDQGPWRVLTIVDDGCGMDEELLSRVTDPFATTRTTRPVGLGLPLLKLAAEQTGGTLKITSRKEEKGEVNRKVTEDKDKTAKTEGGTDGETEGEAFAAGSKHGTRVRATFDPNHIDCVPLGDVAGTVATLIQGDPNTNFRFEFALKGMEEHFELDTDEIRQVLGSEVPIESPEVLLWVSDCVKEALTTQNETK